MATKDPQASDSTVHSIRYGSGFRSTCGGRLSAQIRGGWKDVRRHSHLFRPSNRQLPRKGLFLSRIQRCICMHVHECACTRGRERKGKGREWEKELEGSERVGASRACVAGVPAHSAQPWRIQRSRARDTRVGITLSSGRRSARSARNPGVESSQSDQAKDGIGSARAHSSVAFEGSGCGRFEEGKQCSRSIQ